MATATNVICILLEIFLIFPYFVAADSDRCTQDGPCRCIYDNDTAVDLHSIGDHYLSTSTNERTKEGWNLIAYYYNPCKDFAMIPDNKDAPNNCIASAACKRVILVKDNGNVTTLEDQGYQPVGFIKDATFIPGDYLQYHDKDKLIKTTVHLVCSSQNSLQILLPFDPLNTMLVLFSPSACLVNVESSGHSLGTSLLIIVFLMGLAYLGIGYSIKYFLMGARGTEAVPNITFWRELPDLIRDGIAFVQNGFRPPSASPSVGTPGASPNPNTYDSI